MIWSMFLRGSKLDNVRKYGASSGMLYLRRTSAILVASWQGWNSIGSAAK